MYRIQLDYAESETSHETSEIYSFNSKGFSTAFQEKNKIIFKMAETKLTLEALTRSLENIMVTIKKNPTA